MNKENSSLESSTTQNTNIHLKQNDICIFQKNLYDMCIQLTGNNIVNCKPELNLYVKCLLSYNRPS